MMRNTRPEREETIERAARKGRKRRGIVEEGEVKFVIGLIYGKVREGE